MMFTEALAAKIVKGEKTQTSRVLSDNPRSPWYRNRAAGVRYPVGKVFTVNPGRGVERVAECEVTARFRSTIQAEITHAFKAEGFATPLIFAAVWGKIHPAFDPREVVDVVRFKLVGPDCQECDGAGGGVDWNGEEGSGPWTCDACFGTGVEPSSRAVDLIERLR